MDNQPEAVKPQKNELTLKIRIKDGKYNVYLEDMNLGTFDDEKKAQVYHDEIVKVLMKAF